MDKGGENGGRREGEGREGGCIQFGVVEKYFRPF